MAHSDRSPLFTVFTPTYNRAKVLHRVYESLRVQTFRDFEWLIIDDGSSDNTQSLVEGWKNDPSTWFPIRYEKQNNNHKKSAHNNGVKKAKGTLFLPFDSDDKCVPEALERLAHHWFAIPEKERDQFSAVTGLCVYDDGAIVGDRFPCKEWIDSDSLEMRYRYGVKGEKWGFQRLDVLRKFLFPADISGHVPESVVWSKIAISYKTRFINEVLRTYCQDSDGSVNQVMRDSDVSKHAEGLLYWKQSILSWEVAYFRYSPVSFILDAARLTRFYFHCPRECQLGYWPESIFGRLLTCVMFPFGVLWWLLDYSKASSK